jgi:hypothetical protein
MVGQCYLLMISSATEIVNGVENVWKSGPSVGCHAYPDFGQYMPVNYFKAFYSAAPYAGQLISIGMKTPVMYLGMSFYHVLQTLMTSDSALSRQFSGLLMSQ